MEKPPNDPKRFGLLPALDDFLRKSGLTLSNEKGREAFIQHLADTANKHQNNPALIHGLRIQTMFAYFAAALGSCKIITEEDSGEFFTENGNLKRPDFRILLQSGQEILVEVKNFNPGEPMKPYVLEAEYAHQLRDYAASFGKPLLFAIYWRPWAIWTLNTLKNFDFDGAQYSLLLTKGLKNDQNALLGDRQIGITKPLTFRLYTDPSYKRKIDEVGQCEFKIQKAVLTAGGRDITDALEHKLAWYFFLYGSWIDVEQPAYVVDGDLIWWEMIPTRDDPNPEQKFIMVGRLSEMICRQFNSVTTEDGKVTRLAPEKDPSKFGVRIPGDYKSDVLGIWQFTIKADEDVFSS
jgi:hypothetical protein